MSAPRKIVLSIGELRALNSILGWVEAAGDETEWHETSHPQERAALVRAAEKLRAALRGSS